MHGAHNIVHGTTSKLTLPQDYRLPAIFARSDAQHDISSSASTALTGNTSAPNAFPRICKCKTGEFLCYWNANTQSVLKEKG